MANAGVGDMNVTQEEVSKLTRAMKNDQFRSHMDEYCKEISDPAHRKEYLDYLAQLEAKGEMPDGQQLLRCQPGCCVKTTLCFKNGQTQKCFINIVHSERLEDLTFGDGRTDGQNVKLPYSLSPPRPDRDNKDQYCLTCDMAVSRGTFQQAVQNPQILKMLVDTASDGLGTQFLKGFEEVRKDFKVMQRISCKGREPMPMSVKGELLKAGSRPSAKPTLSRDGVTPGELKKMREDAKARLKADDDPLDNGGEVEEVEAVADTEESSQAPRIRVPKHRLVHSGFVDFTDYMQASHKPTVQPVNIPKTLKLVVELPSVKRSGDILLEVTSDSVVVEVSNKYYLDLSLSYDIWEDRGVAKFDKGKQTLTLELPVRQTSSVPRPLAMGEEGEGVEDDGGVSDDDAEDLLDLEQETAAATPVVQEREQEVTPGSPVPDTGQVDAGADLPHPTSRREHLDITPSATSLKFVQTTSSPREECEEQSRHDAAETAVWDAPQDAPGTALDADDPADDSIAPWVEVVSESSDRAVTPSKRVLPPPLQRYVSATSQLLRPLSGQPVSSEDVEHIQLTRWHQTRENFVLLIPLADVREVASLQLSLTGRLLDLSFLTCAGTGASWHRKHAECMLRWGVDPRQWHADFSTTEPRLSVVLRKLTVEMWDDAFDVSGLAGMSGESSPAVDDVSWNESVPASLSEPSAPASTTLAVPPAVIVEDSAELDVAAPVVYASSGGKSSNEAMPPMKTDTSFTSQSAMAMGQAVLLRTRLMYELL